MCLNAYPKFVGSSRQEATAKASDLAMRKYMFALEQFRVHFVSKFIGNRDLYTNSQESFLDESFWMDLVIQFDDIYKNGVRQIVQNFDPMHCGDDVHSLLKDEGHMHKNDKKEMKLFVKTAREWRSITDKDDEKKHDQCQGSGQCVAAHRISFVMTLFREHFLKQVVYKKKNEKPSESQYLDLFTQCLNDYDAVSLLNDYHHIRSEHPWNANEKLRDCEDRGLYTACSRSLRLMRVQDGSEYQKLIESLDLNTRERNLLETTIRIHSYLNHTESDEVEQKEEGMKDTESDEKEQKDEEMEDEDDVPFTDPTLSSASKFVNEIRVSLKMDGLLSCFQNCGASSSQYVEFRTWLHHQQFDTDSLNEELKMMSEVADSNVSLILQHVPSHRRILREMIFHLKRLDSFTFGATQLFHWEQFQHSHPEQYINRPKYSNLKEECLRNKIYSISLRVFNNLLTKAVVHQKIETGRSMRAKNCGNTNDLYDIPPDSPLSVAHIMAVIMYTDMTDLQREYKKKGCRERKPFRHTSDSAFIEFKNLHQEISWWYKLLVECVIIYGSTPTANQTFYTGLNKKFVFDSMVPRFHCPFSTTTSTSVAGNFRKSSGVILKMKPAACCLDKCLNVEWISCHDHERERLFVHAHELMIVDIMSIEGGKWKYIAKYIRSITLFDAVLKGHYIDSIFQNQKAQTEAILVSLIHQYKWDAMVMSEVSH